LVGSKRHKNRHATEQGMQVTSTGGEAQLPPLPNKEST